MSISPAQAHNRRVVLSVYHSLLKAIHFAFKGDQNAILNARMFARESFDKNKSSSGSVEAEQGIEHAKGVTQILRENVVQGSKDASDPSKPFKLNIHKDIERGDNESIKMKEFPGRQKSFKSMKS